MAKTTISKLKSKLDKLFSLYIRQRNKDFDEFVSCFTCGVKKHWKQMHAGHFQSRKHLTTRWDEVNVQVQCPKCNLFNQGEQYKFGLYLDQKYGEGTSDELHQRAMTIVKLSRTDYEEAIKNIENKLKDI